LSALPGMMGDAEREVTLDFVIERETALGNPNGAIEP
jgi:hypothetical protein